MPIFIAYWIVVGVVSMAVMPKQRPPSLIEGPTVPQPSATSSEPRPPLPTLIDRAHTYLARLDEHYQAFIQTHLDPWLTGHLWNEQLRLLTGHEQQKLSPLEKQTNRTLALGIGALGLLALAHLTGWPLTPIVVAIGIYNFWLGLQEGWRVAIEERRFSIMHLTLLYLVGLWLGGHYLVGTIGLVFGNLCHKIELLTRSMARYLLSHLFYQQPQQVWVILDGVEMEIPFERLQRGDILVLDAGQVVPIDGIIVHGVATLDQHRLTGESQPTEKTVGDPVLASTLVLGGRIHVRVEKTGIETTAGRIGDILNRTVERQEIRLVDQFKSLEKTRVPMLAGGALGWIRGGPQTAVATLGCNFLIGTIPLRLLTLLNGLQAGAQRGILIKDGRVLERLPGIDTIVFDKTGTLTLEQPRVVQIHTRSGYSEAQVLTLAAAVEQRQTHPIAQAILAEAAKRQLVLPAMDKAHYELGYGLTMWLEGQRVRVGSGRFMEMEHLRLPASLRRAQDACQEQGHSLVLLAVETKVVGAIELAAALRPQAKRVIDWLKQRGLAVYILSGDQDAPTRKLAAELGMTGYFANTLPEQKTERIKQLQAQGQQVCFVGDGINDAIALRQATVSISLRGATTVAIDAAQIVLMNDDLMQLPVLLELAQDYEQVIATNATFAERFSLAAAAGVLLIPSFRFGMVELLWNVQFAIGLGIANRPLLKREKGAIVSD
ncbi:MAG: heavy metal translocating P-type ATPase [Candidatus Competibacteraceae bacterium]